MSQGTVFPNFSGLREDLADVISIVDNKNTPVTSTARKGADITNPGVFSWQADEYKDPSFDGVLTNADVCFDLRRRQLQPRTPLRPRDEVPPLDQG